MPPPHKKKARPRETPSVAALLRSAGLRRTPTRIALLNLLAADSHPLSAQQIMEKLPEYTDAVTVYRSLTTLTKKGLLHRVHGDDRVWRFAMGMTARTSPHEHAHFVCDDCGTVECFNEVPIPRRTTKELKGAKGYDIRYAEILIHGSCPRCHHSR